MAIWQFFVPPNLAKNCLYLGLNLATDYSPNFTHAHPIATANFPRYQRRNRLDNQLRQYFIRLGYFANISHRPAQSAIITLKKADLTPRQIQMPPSHSPAQQQFAKLAFFSLPNFLHSNVNKEPFRLNLYISYALPFAVVGISQRQLGIDMVALADFAALDPAEMYLMAKDFFAPNTPIAATLTPAEFAKAWSQLEASHKYYGRALAEYSLANARLFETLTLVSLPLWLSPTAQTAAVIPTIPTHWLTIAHVSP